MFCCTTLEVKQWRNLCIQHLGEAVKIKASFVLALVDLALLYAEEKNLSRYSGFCPFIELSLGFTWLTHPSPVHLYFSLNSSSLPLSLRAEELFQQGSQNLSESDKGICQIFHQRYADFHLYHTRKEDEAIDHYTQVGFRSRVVAKADMCVWRKIYFTRQ